MSAEKLYTPELLGLAVELADYPPIETLALHGEVRSPTCGSVLVVDLCIGADGRISRLGLRVRACAVGQAAACIFAREASGRNLADLRDAHDAIAAWLTAESHLHDPPAIWPSLYLLDPARGHKARHGAILNPWKAAILALSSGPAAS